MKVNFEIENNIALNFQGHHLDLHNTFDFLGFDYSIVNQIFTMRWEVNLAYENNPIFQTVSLIHKGVNYLKISERDFEMPFSEDTCLMELTYAPSNLRDDNDSLYYKTIPDDSDDILYSFASEQKIRVNCNEIELISTPYTS